MAFQASDIKISGSLGGLSFYNSVFGWLVRTKGGPSRKQFKNSPSLVRSRENSSEFTACSRAACAVRRTVLAHTGLKDKTLYHRLIKVMRLLANDDQHSIRGERDPLKGIHTNQGRARLKEFKLSEDLCLYDVLLLSGFLKEAPLKDHEAPAKVSETNTPLVPSLPGKRKRTQKRTTVYHRPKPPLPNLPLRQSQKHTQLNTAFG